MTTKKSTASSSNSKDLLKQVFYGVGVNHQDIAVVMELSGVDQGVQGAFPQGYILVIDVSGSMDEKLVDGDSRSLLERMKIFATLFINDISEESFVSIVDFSDTARIIFPMTKMNKDGKAKAVDIISKMHPLEYTNLSDALLVGLEASKNEQKKRSFDCIILFTDGEANRGITDPVELSKEYEKKMKVLGRANRVQLVLLTIGNYRPYMLKEMAKRFSSDSLYWFNITDDIEAEMLIPLFLRKKVLLTDLTVNLTCLNGVKFVKDSASSGGLQNLGSDLTLQYFIYFLPNGTVKHILFRLDISGMKQKKQACLSVECSYLDSKLNKKNKSVNLVLCLACLKDLKLKEDDIDNTSQSFGKLKDILVFRYPEEYSTLSWKNAQRIYSCVMEQLIRQAVISAVNQAIEYLDKNTEIKGQYLEQTKSKFNSIKIEAGEVLGSNKTLHNIFLKNVKQFADILEHISTYTGDANWIRLTAMESSLNMEMPTATGVFTVEMQNNFMPTYAAEELKKYKKKIKKPDFLKSSNEFKEFENLTLQQLDQAIIEDIQSFNNALRLEKLNEITQKGLKSTRAKIKALKNRIQPDPRLSHKYDGNVVRYNSELGEIEKKIKKRNG